MWIRVLLTSSFRRSCDGCQTGIVYRRTLNWRDRSPKLRRRWRLRTSFPRRSSVSSSLSGVIGRGNDLNRLQCRPPHYILHSLNSSIFFAQLWRISQRVTSSCCGFLSGFEAQQQRKAAAEARAARRKLARASWSESRRAVGNARAPAHSPYKSYMSWSWQVPFSIDLLFTLFAEDNIR